MLSEYPALLSLGARWRVEHEACCHSISSILAALSRDEFSKEVRELGKQAGLRLYAGMTAEPDFLGRPHERSEHLESQIAEMLGDGYVKEIG